MLLRISLNLAAESVTVVVGAGAVRPVGSERAPGERPAGCAGCGCRSTSSGSGIAVLSAVGVGPSLLADLGSACGSEPWADPWAETCLS
eukprot:3460603-Pyramimonas_sp.AAC.1